MTDFKTGMRRTIAATTAAWAMTAMISACCLLTAACSSDSYDSGTGAYSLVRADFVEAHSSAAGTIDYVLTDDNGRLTLTAPQQAGWASRADSLYRAVLYYTPHDDGRAEVMTLAAIPVLRPKAIEEYEEGIKTDPLTFESIWTSANGKYINIGFYLKNGSTGDASALHTIGMAALGVTDNADGTRTAQLQMYHNQGGMPEYYSSKYYVSMPLAGFDADSVAITINTYNGTITRRLKI